MTFKEQARPQLAEPRPTNQSWSDLLLMRLRSPNWGVCHDDQPRVPTAWEPGSQADLGAQVSCDHDGAGDDPARCNTPCSRLEHRARFGFMVKRVGLADRASPVAASSCAAGRHGARVAASCAGVGDARAAGRWPVSWEGPWAVAIVPSARTRDQAHGNWQGDRQWLA